MGEPYPRGIDEAEKRCADAYKLWLEELTKAFGEIKGLYLRRYDEDKSWHPQACQAAYKAYLDENERVRDLWDEWEKQQP